MASPLYGSYRYALNSLCTRLLSALQRIAWLENQTEVPLTADQVVDDPKGLAEISVKIYGNARPELYGVNPSQASAGIQEMLDKVGQSGGGCCELSQDYVLDSTVTSDYSNVTVVQKNGSKLIYAGPTGNPAVESKIASRPSGESLEGVVWSGVEIDGNGRASHCIDFERFTRSCSVEDGIFQNALSHGVKIENSWSFSLLRNRMRLNGGWGLWLQGLGALDGLNANDLKGNHITENVLGGLFGNKIYAMHMVSNTSEYNKSTNIQIGGVNIHSVGNYFEGFDLVRTAQGGEETSVILGTDDVPFANSLFCNYVNGGSAGATSFIGDGIELKNVVASEIKNGGFSASTRHEMKFKETDTCHSNKFDLSFDAAVATLSAARIRNTTSGITGGVKQLKGPNAFNNTDVSKGSSFGVRSTRQIKVNGQTGSVSEDRIAAGGIDLFAMGKRSSALNQFSFNALGGGLYSFDTLVKIPTMTSAQINLASAPFTSNELRGAMVNNSTIGKMLIYRLNGWEEFSTSPVSI